MRPSARAVRVGYQPAVGHRRGEGPGLGGEVEDGGVVAALERVVVQGSAGRQHPSVGQEGVATAEEVERCPVRCAQGGRMGELVPGRVPDHAGEDALGLVAEQRTVEADRAAAGAGEEEHLAAGEQRSVDRQDAGEERQQLPRTVSGRVGVERQYLVQSGVDPGRVVDHEGEQLPCAAQARDRDAAAGVLPGEPARYAHPPLPVQLGQVPRRRGSSRSGRRPGSDRPRCRSERSPGRDRRRPLQ